MVNGYNGEILFVDLTSGSTTEESLPEEVYRAFIGGLGLGVRILYERMKPKVDPLGPDNMLGFLIGPMTGTGVHGARFQLVAKSPLTGGWGDANCGGSFAPELKAAGYDGVFFSGVSPKPVYLFLHDGRAELKDATYLWGKDTVETEESLQEELGDKRVKVACIGPAGEAKSLMAAVMHGQSAAARCGLGAVMGAKHLKAFAVRGTKKVPIAAPERFTTLRREYLKTVKKPEHPWAKVVKKYGTPIFMDALFPSGDVPVKNWTLQGKETFPSYTKLCAEVVCSYQTRKHACLGCPLAGKGWVRIEKSPYGIVEGAKPEYETLALMGTNCLIDDLAAVTKANDLCNRYGLDTIETGSVIALAMEAYELGAITKDDTDGVELTWGNGEVLIAMVEKIGRREGFGAVLADGSKRAGERIGKGCEKLSMQSGGQALPSHDPRHDVGLAWGYACDPAPGRHTPDHFKHSHDCGVAFPYSDRLNFPKLDSFDVEANAPIYAVLSSLDRLWTAAGLCLIGMWPETLPLIDFMSALTGWDFTLDEGIKAGHRINTLRQAFNIREEIDTTQWLLPERIAAVPDTGPLAGRKLDFKGMKKKGYAALGWDGKTGKPLDSTLEELGLKELVGQLP